MLVLGGVVLPLHPPALGILAAKIFVGKGLYWRHLRSYLVYDLLFQVTSVLGKIKGEVIIN